MIDGRQRALDALHNIMVGYRDHTGPDDEIATLVLSEAKWLHDALEADPKFKLDAEHGWVFYGPDGQWHWSESFDDHESVEDQRPATSLEKQMFARFDATMKALNEVLHSLSPLKVMGHPIVGLDMRLRDAVTVAVQTIGREA